ncbi:protein trichome birefringence-like 38 [Beta vulgaris subsp. vulgaris]|uniref:protein trichome birefringence-like 38 n=1 Tax=Beta vulgaris subsp. vulgaris TaxID=3555 RepID=UPI0020372689|nr:protein trichome birefringence-like 38 [Beta vulgaris subsp. vulgaris]
MKALENYMPKVMELSSTIKDTWKVFLIGSLISCLMLLLLLTENDQHSLVSNARITVLEQQQSPTTSMPSFTSLPPTTSAIEEPPPPPIASIIANTKDVGSNMTTIGDILKPNVVTEVKNVEEATTNNKPEKKCDIFDGRWVYKPEVDPSYCPLRCPFIEEKMSCQSNGRPDFEYQKWVWEARDCDIPMLNGTDMLERFRNKRIVLVGDSLNRNMWESLACILYSSIPYPSTKAEIRFEGKSIRTTLKVKDAYNFTVEFFWSPFLVDLNKNHSSGKKVLMLDKLSPNSEYWPGGDIMIFNSGMWWAQSGYKKGWDLVEYKGKLIEDMPLHQAYTRGMNTWANWVKKNVDPQKTTVFFRSISAEHKSPQYNQWCYTKTQPLVDEPYKSSYPNILIRVIERIVRGMTNPQVKYLNVTKLSQYRIDAHPSIYRNKDWKIRVQINKHNLSSYTDCGHWCLPGIPDTWNRLFYASLLLDNFGGSSTS